MFRVFEMKPSATGAPSVTPLSLSFPVFSSSFFFKVCLSDTAVNYMLHAMLFDKLKCYLILTAFLSAFYLIKIKAGVTLR